MNLPAPPPLLPSQAHVWKVPLASTKATLHDLPALLSPPEQDRAARFAFEKDHARFVSCRASLRLLLAAYTGLPPEEITFRYEPQGKPALAAATGWQFNVSHSRDLAAIVISRQDSVGIDLELIDPGFPRNDVAPDILSPNEIRDLAALPTDSQPAYFFQLWTLKEALLKAIGSGFFLDPRDIRLRLDTNLNPQLISAPPDFINATLHRLTLDPAYSAALAVLARVSDLAFFTL